MKRIFKSLFLLGAVGALVGCNSKVTEISYQEFSIFAMKQLNAIKHNQLPRNKYHFDIVMEGREEVTDQVIETLSNAELEVDFEDSYIVESSVQNFHSYMKGVDEYATAGSTEITFLDENLGVVRTIENKIGRFYTIWESVDEVNAKVEANERFVTAKDYFKDYCIKEIIDMDVVFVLPVSMLEMFTFLSEKAFKNDVEFGDINLSTGTRGDMYVLNIAGSYEAETADYLNSKESMEFNAEFEGPVALNHSMKQEMSYISRTNGIEPSTSFYGLESIETKGSSNMKYCKPDLGRYAYLEKAVFEDL